MQTSKFLTAFCAVACSTAMVYVHAQDNPAQAAARAALMQQLNSEPAPAATPPPAAPKPAKPAAAPVTPAPVTPPVKTAPVVVPAPASKQPVQEQPAPAAVTETDTVSKDNAAQAAARAALMQQLDEPASNPATSVSAPETTSPPVVVVPVTTTTPAPTPAPAPATTTMAAKPVAMPTASQQLEYKPIVAPPLPISATQQEQLQALNAKYMANQIAPADYFKQRAAILAQH